MSFEIVGDVHLSACIYCSSEQQLSDEHIVPYGLHGEWILRNGSCRPCSVATSAVEGRCIHRHYRGIRDRFGAPSRNKRPKVKSFEQKVGQTVEHVNIAVEQAPFILADYQLQLPLLMVGKHSKPTTLSFTIVGATVDEKNLGGMKIPFTEDYISFARMHEKIGHAAAYGTIGGKAITPYLVPYILGVKTDHATVFGGIDSSRTKGTALHELEIKVEHSNDGELLVVAYIRLFATLGGSTMVVVVGKTDESRLKNAGWHFNNGCLTKQ